MMKAAIEMMIISKSSKQLVLNFNPLNPNIDFIIEKALCKFSDLKKISVKFTYIIVI